MQFRPADVPGARRASRTAGPVLTCWAVVRVVRKGRIMTAPQSRSRQAKPLDAGCLQPEIGSFGLHLAAEGKAARTVRTYTEAVQWFAAAHLRRDAGAAIVATSRSCCSGAWPCSVACALNPGRPSARCLR